MHTLLIMSALFLASEVCHGCAHLHGLTRDAGFAPHVLNFCNEQTYL